MRGRIGDGGAVAARADPACSSVPRTALQEGNMVTGERVRRIATGEDGVVLDAGDGELVQVAFPSGTVWIDPEELRSFRKVRLSGWP